MFEDKICKYQFIKMYMQLSERMKDNLICYENNSCPYCGCVLDNIVEKKTKCKNCKNYIYKKNNYYTKDNYLIKEDQLQYFSDIVEYKKILERFDTVLEGYNHKDSFNNDEHYIDINKKVNEYNNIKGIATVRDFIFSFANELFNDSYKMCYYHFLKTNGKDYYDCWEEYSNARHYCVKAEIFYSMMIHITSIKRQDLANEMFPFIIHLSISSNILSRQKEEYLMVGNARYYASKLYELCDNSIDKFMTFYLEKMPNLSMSPYTAKETLEIAYNYLIL